MRTRTLFATVFMPLPLLVWGCSDNKPDTPSKTEASASQPTKKAPAPAVASRSGREVYTLYCAHCHGVTGDGKGTTELDRPARSFKDGGFSFGNTPEAIFRTVTNGIGGTPMPGFKSGLSDEERRQVAEYVVSLGPEPVPEAGAEAVMTVWNRPVFARGQFSSIVAGAPEVARGLLVGTIDGLSFQYAVDDVRLLGVRQGDFVRRSDWTGRGGTPLEPLGKLIHLLGGGTPPPMFESEIEGRGREKLRAQLRSTAVEGSHAWLKYDLVDPASSKTVATVRERGEVVTHENGSGFRRIFEVSESVGAIHLSSSGIPDFPQVDSAEWVRNGAVVSLTEASRAGAVLDPPIDSLSDTTLIHTVLILADATDETYEKLMLELNQ